MGVTYRVVRSFYETKNGRWVGCRVMSGSFLRLCSSTSLVRTCRGPVRGLVRSKTGRSSQLAALSCETSLRCHCRVGPLSRHLFDTITNPTTTVLLLVAETANSIERKRMHQTTDFRIISLSPQGFKIMVCTFMFRRIRRSMRLLTIPAVVFVCLGTFYFSWWDISWLGLDASVEQGGDDDAWVVSTESEPGLPLRPVPPVCINESFPVLLKNRYCAWNTTLQDCYETLMPTFHLQPSWVFLGDAGMANIPYFLSVQWPSENLTINTRRNPCQNLIYFGLPPPDDGWKAPNPEKAEGPAGLGKQQPYCMDCTNCWNVRMTNAGSGNTTPANTNELSVEYLVVEYARDVSVPSRVTQTTQETAAFYLSQKPPSVCVASAGLNDAAIQPPITQEMYLQNADKYLGLLQRTCEHVIWLSLHAVVEGERGVTQTNCRLQQWKNSFMGLIERRDYDNVYVLDIWEKSFHSDFHNPTCLGKKFYASLSRLFKSLMTGPDLTNIGS